MVNIVPLNEIEAVAGLKSALPEFDLAQCRRQRCDAHAVALRDGNVVARASLWWDDTPGLNGRRAGAIGHFSASGADATRELLDTCGAELRRRGCGVAVGPMDGNTWRRYRFITERGSEPPFLMEPDNPDDWPKHWLAARFEPLASYFSALNENLAHEDAQVTRAGARLMANGIRLRPLAPRRFADELKTIYAISARSFTENFLYTPIAEAEFLAQYAAIQPRVRPELVLIAEHAGEAVGYLFALPDAHDTVIIKTVAVLPERRCAGLGVWLVQEAQRVARELGFRRAIHALMHESNNSLNLSARYAKPFRRYALYSRPLT